MSNSFLTRVSAERRILAVVNEKMSRARQLTGLSSAAIIAWRAIVGLTCTATINPILVSLAEKCQRLSDRSNETFLPLEQEEAKQIERQLVDLKKEVEKCL